MPDEDRTLGTGPTERGTEREVDQALDAWSALVPPADFADRVLAARAPVAPTRSPRTRRLAGIATLGVAAAAALVALWPTSRAASGVLSASQRTTERLGDRGLAVAEPASELTWQIDAGGAADIVQRAGNVFYRVERGGAFVVHTPAGDVRVTGTCFRIEVDTMNTNQKLVIAGLAGAALATTVLVTVYEGRVTTETASARTELAAGTRATLRPDGTTVVADTGAGAVASAAGQIDDARATREQLLERTRQQEAQLAQLRARLAQATSANASAEPGSVSEPGRAWYDPSPEKLAAWAAECRIRADEPSLEDFEPIGEGDTRRDLEPGERDGYNAALTEMATQWKDLVRALYVETTGDTTDAEMLSIGAMRREIEDKSPPDERARVLQRIARERAGLAAPPTDLARTTTIERLVRAHTQLGDQSEAALARRIGAARAHVIRGEGWSSRSESAGCPGPGH
jgi:hypothetical protein